MIIEDITLQKSIGKGSFGEVFLTSRKNTRELFATKKVSKSLVTQEKIKKYFNNEINILQNVAHPNIIKLYEIKKTLNNFYLIFDYCNGGGLSNCLEKYMNRYKRPFTQEIVQYIMRQLVSGIQYIHNQAILHRDLKLDNVLIHFDNEKDIEDLNLLNSKVKIIDFGFARYLEADSLAQSVLGSPINMDPQILRKMRKIDNNQSFGYDEKADIWSLGTICYELLMGTPPFDANNYDELVDKIQKGNYKIPNSLKLSKECISFLNGQLQFDPKQRLDINTLIRHEFLTKNVNQFEQIDLKKAEAKFNNSNDIILNTKDNKSIWFLFEQEKMNLNEISPSMLDKNTQNTSNIPKSNGIKSAPEDIIGSLINATDQIRLQTEGNSNPINRVDSDNSNRIISERNNEEIDQKLKNMLLESFDEMNKDSFYVEPMLIPIIPNTDPKILQLDI